MRFVPLGLLAVVTAVAAGCGGARHSVVREHARQRSHDPRHVNAKPKPPGPFPQPLGKAHLVPGSDSSVLPGDVLIADRSNDRLLVVDPHGRIVWRFPQPGRASLPLPDDAFFSPDGRRVVVTVTFEDPTGHGHQQAEEGLEKLMRMVLEEQAGR